MQNVLFSVTHESNHTQFRKGNISSAHIQLHTSSIKAKLQFVIEILVCDTIHYMIFTKRPNRAEKSIKSKTCMICCVSLLVAPTIKI
jgi:hypothetical protein